jgi:TRAP-type C4-dicarboxylate transport system substrate-binding protein
MLKLLARGSALLALMVPLLAAAQATTLRFAVFIPEETPVVKDVFRAFATHVNRDANGLVNIEVFTNGALGRNPLQQAQMVKDGVADLAWVILPQARGLFRDTEVLELPGVFRDVAEATTVSAAMLAKGHLRGFDDFYPVGLVGTGPTSIHSRGQIKTLADIKDKKVRSGGQMESATITALGGVPVGLTTTEVIEAIGRGNVDALTTLPPLLFDFGFAQVTNTDYFIRLGNLPMAILMNRKKFDSLPKPAQDVIRKYSGDWITKQYNQSQGPYYESLTKRLQADPKRKVIMPGEAEIAQANNLYKPLIRDWESKSPRNQELLKLLEQEIAIARAQKR